MGCFRPCLHQPLQRSPLFLPILSTVDVESIPGIHPAALLTKGAASPGPQPAVGSGTFSFEASKARSESSPLLALAKLPGSDVPPPLYDHCQSVPANRERAGDSPLLRVRPVCAGHPSARLAERRRSRPAHPKNLRHAFNLGPKLRANAFEGRADAGSLAGQFCRRI